MSNATGRIFAAARFERVLAYAALLLLALVIAALVRGRGELAGLSGMVVLHLATVGAALALTPVQLLRPLGDRLHRRIGWLWAALMTASALASFAVREANPGHFSAIHLLSAFTLVMVPWLVISARRGILARHRSTAGGLVTGAVLVAGYFTLLPARTLGSWLWG